MKNTTATTTTTSHFQVVPNFFLNKEECDANHFYNRPQTNSRYRGFTQTHFTCGDEEQFEKYRDYTNFRRDEQEEDTITTTRITFDNSALLWNRNVNLDPDTVTNTFRYIFNKFKKGIFIKIVNNELKVFLPFSKHNFENEWSSRLQVTPGYGSHLEFIEHIYKIDNRSFNPKKVNKFPSAWIGNNAIIRFEYPPTEDDTGIPAFADFFQELTQSRKIPDVEFFFNKRDFPIIRRDLTEAYDHLFGKNVPLLSHRYDKYSPILSCCTTDAHADIPCPTWDDWSRVQKLESGKMFTKSNFDYDIDCSIEWADKIETAIFRGSSTGAGVTVDTNPRLKAAYMSSLKPKDGSVLLLDAGITSWNVRPRKLHDVSYLQTIEIDTLPFGLVEKMTPREQCRYKYILHIPGHVAAYRLSLELGMKSVILKVESEYQVWYSAMLKPYVHYVPVKADLSDLLDKIKWCKNNDDKCRTIAENALEFYKSYLTKDGMLDYMQNLLTQIHKQSCTYTYLDMHPFDVQYQEEWDLVKSTTTTTSSRVVAVDHKPVFPVAHFPRSSAFLDGLKSYFDVTQGRSIMHTRSEQPIYKTVNTEIYCAKIADKVVSAKAISEARQKETIHEAFVGITEINRLLRVVPNFVYTFGVDATNSYIVRENIQGMTLYEYLTMKTMHFNMLEFAKILVQVALAIQVAQNEISFVHWDLMPWNIILLSLNERMVIEYPVLPGKVYKFETKCMPIIFDYGKSHVVSSISSEQYTRMNLFSFSSIQDILSLLFSSLHTILDHQKLEKGDMRLLFELTLFFTGTTFRKEKFTSVSELKKFLDVNKKYSTITTSKKYELEKKTPLDFVDFIVFEKCPDLGRYVTVEKTCCYANDDGFGDLIVAGMLDATNAELFITTELRLNPFFLALANDDDERRKNLSIRFYKNFTTWLFNNYGHVATMEIQKELTLDVAFSIQTKKRGCTLFDRQTVPKSKARFEDNLEYSSLLLNNNKPKERVLGAWAAKKHSPQFRTLLKYLEKCYNNHSLVE